MQETNRDQVCGDRVTTLAPDVPARARRVLPGADGRLSQLLRSELRSPALRVLSCRLPCFVLRSFGSLARALRRPPTPLGLGLLLLTHGTTQRRFRDLAE